MDEESPDRGSRGGERSGEPRRRTRYRGLFEECWTPVRTIVEAQLHNALVETLGPLTKDTDDELLAKRVKAILLRERAFVQGYLEAVHAELTASINSFVEARASEGQGVRALSLVGHADSEFDAAIDQCAARLRNSVDAEFTAVKVRLINLLQESELRDSELPFRVPVFVRAVAGALRHIGTSEPDLIPLLRAVSAGLGRIVADSYRQIEGRLAESGASDTLTVWHPTVLGSHVGARGRPSTVDRAAAPDPARAGHRPPGLDPTQQSALLSLLERLQPAPSAGAVPAASGAEASAGTAPVPQPRTPGTEWTFDPSLISAVNQALRVAAGAATAAGQAAADAAAAADTGLLRRNLIDTASRKADKLTIELVGLLFERIQRDRHVPDGIKEQLARLQFPLLKVALSDPELFADPRQPARRLLDRIASTSIGWSPEGEDNQRYLEQVRAVVGQVIASPGDTAGAFAQAADRFGAFLEEERTRDDDPVQRARRALAEAENREILAIKATMQVRSAFDGVQLESYLRDFLLDVWVRVLVDASAREKADSGLLKRYLDAIPELVWSVQPKINPGDRKRMIGTIPHVLAVLREGLTRIDWPPERIQQFFGRLMSSHANAVKALELAHGTLQQFTPSTVRIKLDGFRIPTGMGDAADVVPERIKVSDDAVRHTLALNAAGVNHLSAPAVEKLASVAMDHAQAVRAISGWQRGLWFDLRTEAGNQRVVLRWISPKRALYLFTTAGGERAHSLSPDALVAYLQSGWLVAVETAPLFERVVDGVMSDLKHGAQPDPGAAS